MGRIIGAKIPTHNDAADMAGGVGSQVDVYFNLRKKLWSVRSRETGRVLCHCHEVALRGVRFVVGAAGRERVRREGRKNVHAFVRGEVCPEGGTPRGAIWNKVGYNPYTVDSFCRMGPAGAVAYCPINRADYAALAGRSVRTLGESV